MIEIDAIAENCSMQTRVRLDVSGHAGSAPVGFDIVCAGVSALVSSLVLWPEKNSRIQLDTLETKLEKGKALFMAAAIDKDAEILYSVFEMVVDGLEEIAKAYPEYVSIKRKEYP